MCKGKPDCRCCQVHTIRANLLASESRVVNYLGRKTLIIPIIMARADVVMNEALVPAEEMFPAAWNGRPVTVGHPKVDGNNVSATETPEVHQEWSIGTLFNARVDDGVLRAEAWIDIARCNAAFPGLISRIKSQEEINVSTGYFADHEPVEGELNGRNYNMIHRGIRPDHLALLPDEIGACSWEDGCGVRTNRRLTTMKRTFVANVTRAIEAMSTSLASLQTSVKELISQERGDSDHRTMMIADLLSDDRSPFMPEDEYALREMSNDTLKKLRNAYLTDNSADEGDASKGGDPVANKDNAGDSGADVKAIIENALKPIADKVTNLDATINEAISKHPVLAAFNKQIQEKRASLVDRVVANSSISKEVAETMTDEALEAVANSIAPASYVMSYAGRPVPSANDGKDEAAEAMQPTTVVELIRNRKQKGAA